MCRGYVESGFRPSQKNIATATARYGMPPMIPDMAMTVRTVLIISEDTWNLAQMNSQAMADTTNGTNENRR